VQANLVHVVLKEPWQASSISDGALMETGELVLAGLPGPFTDDPHDCPK
jgi:hypothetical protein